MKLWVSKEYSDSSTVSHIHALACLGVGRMVWGELSGTVSLLVEVSMRKKC